MKVRISVITVCYNSAKTIERTIQSVLSQSTKPHEYIIVDGNSNDDTMKIIRQYEPLFEGRMRIVSESDEGIYDAMNKGIRLATGDLINLLNSDDTFEPDALMHVSQAYQSNIEHLILYGFTRYFYKGTEETIAMKHPHRLNRSPMSHQSCYVSKAVYDDFGLYDLQYKSGADYDYMLNIYKNTDTVFVPVKHILANFSYGGFSSALSIAYRDKAKIQLHYGLISKRKYLLLRALACACKFLKH